MNSKTISFCMLFLSLTLVACAPMQLPSPTPEATAPSEVTPTTPEPAATSVPVPTVTPELAATGEIPVLPNLPDYLVPVTPSLASDAIIGPVPDDLQGQLMADIVQRLGGGESARVNLTLVRAEPVIWPDGSLGCPQPGMFYTQVQVEGMWVVYEVDGALFDYRIDQRGRFFLCEGATGGPRFDPNQPTPVLPVFQP